MKNLTQLCFVLFFVVAFSACNKKVSELPEPTATGSNTFGAKVDGQLWVPKSFGIVPGSAILEARYSTNRDIFINARNFASSPVETEFEIYLQHVTEPGVYALNSNTNIYPGHTASYAYFVKRNVTPLNEWITNTQYTGTVTITKADTVNRIVAGTFSFQAINEYNSPQVLVVTEGRFDIKIP